MNEKVLAFIYNTLRNLDIYYDQPEDAEWVNLDTSLKEEFKSKIQTRLEHIDKTSEEIHNAWLSVMLSDGWIYGPTKEVTTKEHPGMLRWHRLPDSHKKKEELLVTLIKVMNS